FIAAFASSIAHPWIFLSKAKKAEQQPGGSNKVKGPSPVQPNRMNQPAHGITERAPYWNCRKEDRQDATARGQRKQIGNDWGRGRTVPAFADPDEYPGEEQNSKGCRQSGCSRGQAPDKHRGTDN